MRNYRENAFRWTCIGVAWACVIVLGVLLYQIVIDGVPWLSANFFTNFPSRFPEKAGIKAAVFGTIWVIGLTTLISVPVGVLTAVYLEEYLPRNRVGDFIQLNISTLAGMPSVVYGLLGLAIFVRFFGWDRSILAGAACLSLLVLPTIIIAAQGAIRAVPQAIRDGAFALGARRYQVVFGQVLPAAVPGIMTGVILAISRAMGETAPLILIGALSYMAFVPEGPMDSFTVLPVQIYNWANRPQAAFHGLAAAGILVLLVILFLFNVSAVYVRNRFQRYR